MRKMTRAQQRKAHRIKKWIGIAALVVCIAAALFVVLHGLAGRDTELASAQATPPAATPDVHETQTLDAPSATASHTIIVAEPATSAGVTSTPQKEEPSASPSSSPTIAPTSAPTTEPTEKPTVAPTPTPTEKEEQPPLLTRMLQKYGQNIADIDTDQLMMLAYDNGVSTLYLYDRGSSGLWRLKQSFPAQVGKNGVSANKVEGDKKTPTGYYALGFAFGNSPQPDTEWTYRDVTTDSYWVDDPDSADYNVWVEGTDGKDWDSAEHLSDATTAYAYALVIEYNMHPVVPGKGSAIFLHCGTSPTAGCIALKTADMLTVLKWLDAGSDARILIADVD